jgi:predicted ATPase/DNA-binding CsgD family transcriptional regulator
MAPSGDRATVPFVGREVELAAIARLIGDCRVLTLTGAGGAGKTRLAFEALRRANAAEQRDTFVVPLVRIASPDLLTAAVLERIGGRQEPGREAIESIAARLAGRPVRLVFDNCEHVVAELAVVLGELLARCPELSVLATSRQPLALDGEIVLQVPAMSLPDPDAQSALLSVVESDAGRLFIACAITQAADFALSPATARAISRICRELDGMPLPITLAAARIGDQLPEEIAAGLAGRMRSAPDRGPARTQAATRQRSLRASLDWSYGLLDAADQVLFRRFAVLSAGTVEDARAVCLPSLDAEEVQARLLSLARRGLIAAQADALLGTTYEMLGTVREYALDLLARREEEDELRNRHLAVFGELAEQADSLLNNPTGRRALHLHVPDLRAALSRAIEGSAPTALAMCEGLAHYWFAADHFAEGRASCARALAVADDCDDAARALVLWCSALLAAAVEDYAEAHALATRGLALAERSGDARALGLCLQITSFALGTVDPQRAVETGSRAIELLRDAGNAHDLGHALMTLASIEALRDRFDSFARLRAEFMSLPEARDDQWLRILLDLHAAWAYLTQGEPRAALRQTNQVLEMVGGEVSMRAALARAHRLHAMARSGEANGALTEGLAALDEARAAGSEVAVLALEQALAIAELAVGDLDSAWRRAEQHADTSALHSAATWHELLARIALERADTGAASAHAAVIREIGGRVGSQRQAAFAQYVEGVAALQDGDLPGAAACLHAALSAQDQHGCRRDAADTLEALGHLAARRADMERAGRLHAASAAARRALGCARVPPDGPELHEQRARVEADLGIEAAAQARAEGERLPLQQAIAYAQRSRGRRQRALAGLGSLTPTELEAARLAASGLSNPEIASRMFISRDTVKVHLSHVYAKLGVTSRTQLGVLLADADPQAVNSDT